MDSISSKMFVKRFLDVQTAADLNDGKGFQRGDRLLQTADSLWEFLVVPI